MNTRRSRFRLTSAMVAAVLMFALGGCGGGASAARDDGVVRVAVFPSLNALGARTAAVEGMFAKVGLPVEFVTTTTPADAVPQLVGEDVDFALMDVSTPTIARSQGMPIVMVAPGATGTEIKENGLGVGNFWVRKNSDIDSVEEIEDAMVGIPQAKSQLWIDVRTVVDRAGGDSSRIQFIEVPNSIAALKSGSVDVVTSAEPTGTALHADPSVELLSGFVSGAVGELAYSYVAMNKTARTRPELVEKFSTAILEANKLLNEDPAVAPRVAATYAKADPALLQKVVYQDFGEQPISRKDVENARERVLRYGLIDADDAPSADEMLADR